MTSPSSTTSTEATSNGERQPALPDLAYKPGWTFKVGGPGNRFLCIYAQTPDSNDASVERTTQHMFEIPAEGDLVRWVFDCLLLCERHETGEFFRVDGERPFFPYHQGEGSPYEIVDRRQHA